jgi:hypothetical protein
LAVAGPVLAAIGELVRALVIIVVVVVLAVAATGTVVALRLRRGPPRLPPGAISGRPVQGVQDRSQPRALLARQEVHLHFHGVTAEDVAAIIARQRAGK